MTEDFRCSVASEGGPGAGAAGPEPIAGTAPTEAEWLLVEQPGSWAAKATGHLAGLVARDGRAQLVRRHGGSVEPGTRVFRASLGAATTVRSVLLDDARDVAALSQLTDADYTPYDGPLFLVCTNGRRDVCCAERGRPVAAALAERWPEATWETTHLGGHRFAATLLALPSGVTLGRLDPGTALDACARLLAGELPLEVTRGRAGRTPPEQAADLHLRGRHGWSGLADVVPLGSEGDADSTRVTLRTPGGVRTVTVTSTPGEPRRASCADLKVKAAPVWSVQEYPVDRGSLHRTG